VSPGVAALRPMLGAIFALPAPAFIVRRLLAGREAPAALVEEIRAAVGSVRSEVLSARARAALAVDASDALRACRLPLLYLGGTDDSILRRDVPDELRAIQPGAELRFLVAPHLVLQSRPREAAAALREFLAVNTSHTSA
jgi:pimeloyl-ACP methyl ester carboxylesterase